MGLRALGSVITVPNSGGSSTTVVDKSATTTETFRGFLAIWTNDPGDETDLSHAYATHACIGMGFDDGTRHVAACMGVESASIPTDRHGISVDTASIHIFDPTTGTAQAVGSVTSSGAGTYTITWSTHTHSAGTEPKVAILAFFGDWWTQCGSNSSDVTGLPDSPDHAMFASAGDLNSLDAVPGWITAGFVSKRPRLSNGSRSLAVKSGSPGAFRSYVSSISAQTLANTSGGLDHDMNVTAFTADGWTTAGTRITDYLYLALGHRSRMPLDGATLMWQNGTATSGNPFTVSGALGTPICLVGTFGKLTSLESSSGASAAEPFGIGFVDDLGIGYCASIKDGNNTAFSRLVKRFCDVERVTLVLGSNGRLALDWASFASGGFTYNLAANVAAAYQCTQVIAVPSSTVFLGKSWVKGGSGASWIK